MLLADAIKEKEYIEKLLLDSEWHIKNVLSVKNTDKFKDMKDVLDSRFNDLRSLYKRHQQFCTLIERAKSNVIIKVKDNELSLSDAVVIINSMKDKLAGFEGIYLQASKKAEKGELICLDLNDLFDEIVELRLDIKTMSSQIEYATWQAEV